MTDFSDQERENQRIQEEAAAQYFSGLRRDEFQIAFTEAEIQARIQELATAIDRDYRHKELILVAMLKGSTHFLSDLSRAIGKAHIFDFIAVKERYQAIHPLQAHLELTKDLSLDIEGRDVLVLEEIVRTGYTTDFMIRHLEKKRPRSIKLAAFLCNPHQMLLDLPLRYVGFEVGFDPYVGYGLDYNEYGRSLPFIARLDPSIFKDVNLPNRRNRP
ncbi:MAG: phosphoribosyltransferase family protein [Eubacteriales bacterium]|nr:phosphoribosyltransferase family protein [Eubacteriales bacterium]